MPGPVLSREAGVNGQRQEAPPAIAALGHLPCEGRLFSGGARKRLLALRGLRGFGTFPQTPFSLTFFEKKVSKEAFNISTKKHLLAGHTHTGQQVLLFTI